MRVLRAFEYLVAAALLVYGILMLSGNLGWGLVLIIAGTAYLIFLARASGYRTLAQLAFRRGDVEKTLHWFGRAWKAQVLGVDAAVTYLYLLLKNGQVESAAQLGEELLSQGARRRPLNAGQKNLVETYRSLVLWKEGKLEEAIFLLQGLYEQGYKTSVLYGSLGYFLLEKGDLVRAEKLNLEARDYNPDDKVILDNLGSTWIRLEKWSQAGEVYTRLMALEPSFPEAWYNHGLTAHAQGDGEKARLLWRKALELPFSHLSTITKETVERALAALEEADRGKE